VLSLQSNFGEFQPWVSYVRQVYVRVACEKSRNPNSAECGDSPIRGSRSQICGRESRFGASPGQTALPPAWRSLFPSERSQQGCYAAEGKDAIVSRWTSLSERASLTFHGTLIVSKLPDGQSRRLSDGLRTVEKRRKRLRGRNPAPNAENCKTRVPPTA
jgi:hypothetical protein